MTSGLPDPRLMDAVFLSDSMRDDLFLGQGTNNKAWRIEGAQGGQSHVVRVSHYNIDQFLDVDHPPVAIITQNAEMDARAAQSIVIFMGKNDKGDPMQIADIQPEMQGRLLGLTLQQRDTRSDKIEYLIDKTDNWGRPAGRKGIRYESNAENIARTNAILWPIAERIAAMPLSFYIQTIKDVMEIEEHGYVIDPSKATNFTLMDHENRLGFIDLGSSSSGRRMLPSELAVVLCQPANQIGSELNTDEDKARRSALIDQTRMNVIKACDTLKIAYACFKWGFDEENGLRERFGLVKPEGVRPMQIKETPGADIPIGHGVMSADIKIPVATSINLHPVNSCHKLP